jgi:hypothetical protein
MDEMQEYEVSELLDGIPYLDKNDWERSRYSIYTNIQMNSKKKLKPTDVLKFSWDNEDNDTTTSITNADIERLNKKSEIISKNIFNNGK